MRALDGVNLVEFSSHLGAAYAAMLLAEQGAQVVKVEPPGGAAGRGTPHFHVANRSKRSVFIDADSKEARDLIGWADIVISGHTPSRAREIGLDYESIKALNPRAMVVSMPPFGSRGPEADLDASEEMVQSRGGIAGNQFTRSGDPAPMTFPVVSYSAGVLAAMAAVAGLLARGRSSEGQLIEVPLLSAALSMQTGTILKHPSLVALYAEGANDPLGPIPSFRLFEAGDGKYLFIACGSTVFFNKFAIVIDRVDLVSDPRFEGAPWGHQEHWPVLKAILEEEIRKKPRDEWLRILTSGDVPCAPVHTREEFIEDEQVRFLGMRQEIVDPTLGKTIQMGVPIMLRQNPGRIAGPAPSLDSQVRVGDVISATSNGDAIREESRFGARDRGPLAGVRVLDFTSYIAGSYGTMILGQLGADVIKIESIHGDNVRHLALAFLGWNQAKRGLSLNLTSDEGRRIVHELAAKSDVLVENMRPGKMRKLGLDYETLSSINPRLVYVSVTGFGTEGPGYDRPGFDPLLQARSGAQAAQGGHRGHPVLLTCSVCDYGAASLAALGCVLALRAREITGRGQACETSLLHAALAFQAGEFLFYDGRPDMENGDAEYRGPSALSRAYRCRDGKSLFVSIADERSWGAMRGLCPNARYSYSDAARQSATGDLATVFSDYFLKMDCDVALHTLREARVPATPVNRIKQLFDDPQVIANGMLADLVHPHFGPFTQTGVLTKFSATAPPLLRPAPLLGEHNVEVLSRVLGYDPAKIADLQKRGVVREKVRVP